MEKYKKGDSVTAFNPKTKYLTHEKEYTVEWISIGGWPAVRNDAGKIKAYHPSNYTP